MIVSINTPMLLFRYKNYKNTDFINLHCEIIKSKKKVWMLKIGKKTSLSSIEEIIKSGGYMVLRSPKSDGGHSYIAHFEQVQETEPEQKLYPQYYEELIDNDENFYFESSNHQWFLLTSIERMSEEDVEHLLMSKTNKPVNEVIDTTRTAVMFIKNAKEIIL